MWPPFIRHSEHHSTLFHIVLMNCKRTLRFLSCFAWMLLLLQPQLQATESTHPLFVPLVANPLEARIGTQVEIPRRKLRLDIGHSFDLMQIDSAEKFRWMAGGDFMTYTRLRSEGRLKFPVETVDYYFGLNTSAIWHEADHDWSARLRLAHISAHLADGLADTSGLLHPHPFVYSREFVDIIGAYSVQDYRFYAGLTAVFSNHFNQPPENLIIPQCGAEWKHPLVGTIKGFAAYDLKLSGVDGTNSFVHAAQLGIILPQRNAYELILSAYYYHGLSLHGLFYATVDDYWGLGFQVGL